MIYRIGDPVIRLTYGPWRTIAIDESKLHYPNYTHHSVLKRAREYLLDEWGLSLGTARSRVINEM